MIAKLSSDLNSPHLEEWQKQHAKLSIATLHQFKSIKHKLNLDSWNVIKPDVGPGSLLVGGLRIVISPEALLSKQVENETWIGGVKFYYSKSKILSKKRADYMGAGLCWYCEEHLPKLGNADYRSSFIVDVPGGELIQAPKSKVRNRGDIQAAAEEIAALWPS